MALEAVEYDHVIALGLGGSNAADNWAALCPACHREKTRDDLRAIAKAKRRKRFQETGRSRAPRVGWGGWAGGSGSACTSGQPGHHHAPNGFSKTLRKRMDGRVEQKCDCEECSRAIGQPTQISSDQTARHAKLQR